MKPLHAVPLFVLGLAVAGALSGTVIADVTTSTGDVDDGRDDHDRRHDHDGADDHVRRRRRPTSFPPACGSPACGSGADAGRRGRGGAGCVRAAAAGRDRQAHARARSDEGRNAPTPRPRSRKPASRRRARTCRSSSRCTALSFVRGSARLEKRFDRTSSDAIAHLPEREARDPPRAGRPRPRTRKLVTARVLKALRSNTPPAGARAHARGRARGRGGVVRGRDRDQPRDQPAVPLQRDEALPDLQRRDRPVDLPDAARPLAHRRQVEEPVVVSAGAGRLGEGPEAGAARARRTRSGPGGWA